MKHLNKILLSSLCLALSACGSSAPGEPSNTDPTAGVGNVNPDPESNGSYKSSYCVANEITKKEDDIFVLFDAFNMAPDIPASVTNVDPLDAILTVSLYSSLSISVGAADLIIAFGPMFATGLCAAELAPDNKCNLTFPDGEGGGLKTVGSATLDTLSFETFTKSASSAVFDLKLSTYSGKVSPYWQGSYQLYKNPADATSVESIMTWRRDGSSEYFDSSSANGDYMKVTERSDCSGTLSRRDTDDLDGSITTIDGLWQLNGTTTTGKVTRCIDGDCDSLTW